jgi:hypothetical protein
MLYKLKNLKEDYGALLNIRNWSAYLKGACI